MAAGEALLAPELARRLIEEHMRGPAPVRGLSNPAIAAGLVVSGATVKTHIHRILAKLSLQTRVQVVVLAYETGMVRPGS